MMSCIQKYDSRAMQAQKCCQMGQIGCHILLVTQKAIMEFQFLTYFWVHCINRCQMKLFVIFVDTKNLLCFSVVIFHWKTKVFISESIHTGALRVGTFKTLSYYFWTHLANSLVSANCNNEHSEKHCQKPMIISTIFWFCSQRPAV